LGRSQLNADVRPRGTANEQIKDGIDIPLIEQVKMRAQVLVPIVKALQAELGARHCDFRYSLKTNEKDNVP